jgi:hypothetical protein
MVNLSFLVLKIVNIYHNWFILRTIVMNLEICLENCQGYVAIFNIGFGY